MTMKNVTVVIGAVGQAIARRVSAGKHVLLADLKTQNAKAEIRLLSTTTGAVIDGVDPLRSFAKWRV